LRQGAKGGTALAQLDARRCLTLTETVGRATVPALCRAAAELVAANPAVPLRCDVAACHAPHLGIVEALARLELTVKRGGGRMALCGASAELLDLLAWCGLPPPLLVEAEREAEEREEPSRVEEEGDSRDPAA
jgi:hypothetical protein